METSKIDAGPAISYGWTSVKKDLWYFVALALLVFIAGSIGSSTTRGTSGWDIIGFFLTALTTCGTTAIALSYYHGKQLPISALFTTFKPYWQVLGASLLLGLGTVVGLVLLIFPGIYFALTYQFTITIIVDKNLGIIEAMRESKRITQGKKMSLLAFDLTMLGVIILGALCLGVGLLVAVPVVWLAGIKVYRLLMPVPSEQKS